MPQPVEVWLAKPTEALAEAGRRLLSAAEQVRAEKFQHSGARREYLVGRWLVRTTLSRHAARAAADWRFEANQYGAPAIVDNQQGASPLRFNLSHTRGLVAVVVAEDLAVGVDVEHTERRARLAAIAHRFFAPSEVQALLALDEREHRDRFFAYWTLKEAYIKARGMGLAIPLGQFHFNVEAAPISIGFDPRLDDDPARWHFELSDPMPDHRLAVAVANEGVPVEVQVIWATVAR